MNTVEKVFLECVEAINSGTLIERETSSDKEFHFQNWFGDRLKNADIVYDDPGRNSYPDFRLVQEPIGFEIKGLRYPGRDADYDCNSQVPMGAHNGREIYYVFGRYPAKPDGNTYPVIDLVICHGSFLNANSDYIHKNRSFRGFGSYGDIMVRDRKVYVAPTPFALAQGTAHRRTLIVPEGTVLSNALQQISKLTRTEVANIVAAYDFNLTTNKISTQLVPNPNAGKEHRFSVYRALKDSTDTVALVEASRAKAEQEIAAQGLSLEKLRLNLDC